MIQGALKLNTFGSGFSNGFVDVCACDTQKSDCGCEGENDGGCGCGSTGSKAQKLMQILSSRVSDVSVRIAKDDFWNKKKYSASLRTLRGDVTVIMISSGMNGTPVVDWGGGGPSGIPDGGWLLQCMLAQYEECYHSYECWIMMLTCGPCVTYMFLAECLYEGSR